MNTTLQLQETLRTGFPKGDSLLNEEALANLEQELFKLSPDSMKKKGYTLPSPEVMEREFYEKISYTIEQV